MLVFVNWKRSHLISPLDEHEHALARKIAQARSGAHQGDIFTDEVTRQFRRIIRVEFQGPEGQLARRTIRQSVMIRVQPSTAAASSSSFGIESK